MMRRERSEQRLLFFFWSEDNPAADKHKNVSGCQPTMDEFITHVFPSVFVDKWIYFF